MVALSFSGITSKGAFWEQILRGEKNQTIRFPRSYPIVIGFPLSLYWKQRVPIKNKVIHLIGKPICVEAKTILFGDVAFNEQNAIDDGFGDLNEFKAWFKSKYPDMPLNQELRLIKWKPLGMGVLV